MSVVSSSPNNSYPSSAVSIFLFLQKCSNSAATAVTISSFIIISFLFLLPLCILVLYHGLQRWRQQRSCCTTSHSDLVTYHSVLANLLSMVGSTLVGFGVFADLPQMVMVGIYFWSTDVSGQMFFHILTCVERYLAVVNPVTYLSLRKAKGIRIRNAIIGFAWLLCIVRTTLLAVTDQKSSVLIAVCTLSIAVIVISLCSLSVLRVLIRPGPGEGGGDGQRVDQSKLRAFYTIIALLAVLLFRFGGTILSFALNTSLQLEESNSCYIRFSAIWFCLPGSLVLPLLFLHRAGKLACCKNSNKSAPGSD